MLRIEDSFCNDTESEVNRLSEQLKAKEDEIRVLRAEIARLQNSSLPVDGNDRFSLSSREIERYSRQILIPQLGVQGQLRLKRSSVLIVGAGGLGCPAGTYLAAAGVGTIGIVDYDQVEISNLHRQVAHKEDTIGLPKSVSFANSIKGINSLVNCIPYQLQLNSVNIKDILPKYDVVIDASDNVPTRYLLNDASVLFKKPLVSGSALRMEGHLTVYNFQGSPCYRCLYPTPSVPAATTNCSDAGVLGPVTGVIGSLQALEAIKIAVGLPTNFNNKMLVFDGECATFRTFNLRGKNPNCQVCATSPSITHLVDYEAFCQTSATDKNRNVCILPESDRITCSDYKKVRDRKTPHLLIDVRPTYEYDICSLPDCINIPFGVINTPSELEKLQDAVKETELLYVICRRGNSSQRAVLSLRECLRDVQCFDIKGGLRAWHHEIDSQFPLY